MQALERSRGHLGALKKMVSLVRQWVQQWGRWGGSQVSLLAQAQKLGRDDQVPLAQQLSAVPPLLEQDGAWRLPDLVRSSSAHSGPTQDYRNSEHGDRPPCLVSQEHWLAPPAP